MIKDGIFALAETVIRGRGMLDGQEELGKGGEEEEMVIQ